MRRSVALFVAVCLFLTLSNGTLYPSPSSFSSSFLLFQDLQKTTRQVKLKKKKKKTVSGSFFSFTDQAIRKERRPKETTTNVPESSSSTEPKIEPFKVENGLYVGTDFDDYFLHIELFHQNIKGNILDLGCGDAKRFAKSASQAASYLGIDIDYQQIQENKKAFPKQHFQFRVANFTAPHFALPKGYDVIICTSVWNERSPHTDAQLLDLIHKVNQSEAKFFLMPFAMQAHLSPLPLLLDAPFSLPLPVNLLPHPHPPSLSREFLGIWRVPFVDTS